MVDPRSLSATTHSQNALIMEDPVNNIRDVVRSITE